MTLTVDGDRDLPGRPRRRLVRLTAVGVTVGVVAAAVVGSTGGTAAAATPPQAQSVGNFLDATVGGQTLDAIAKLKYATAYAPGATSVQNPLDATALNAINAPLTGALQLPTIGSTSFGAVNQVAQARTDGASYGASGAIQNSGGASIGGNNSAYPANATIDLTSSALTGNSPVALPIGTGSAAPLGGVTATIGGVAALASTPVGYGKAGSTQYQIANIDLNIGSPLLGQTLGAITTQLQGGLATLNSAFSTAFAALPGVTLPASCKLTSPTALAQPISLEGGAVTLSASSATITISLGKLLTQLGLDLNKLPANTDLTQYLLAYLADPNGLNKGLQAVVNGLTAPLTTEFTNCTAALQNVPGIGTLLSTLTAQLTAGQATIEGMVTSAVSALAGTTGSNPLAPVASGLANLLDIGVNVQPNGAAGTYTDPLAATPKQGTPVVDGQTIVRAIELTIAGAAGGLGGVGTLPSLSSLGLPSASGFAQLKAARFVAPRQAAVAGTGVATIALANAAAGPSTAAAAPSPTPSTSVPSTSVPNTDLPTGVPAGAAGHQGGASPALPIVLVLLGLILAGGGVTAYRTRGKLGH